ncbi:hypothetical protein [Streptomyces tauricus]|uniref:hypothetical protein n=1 Tax=Streptomyces tauricus TaxID=68274 RepID=UPI0034260674
MGARPQRGADSRRSAAGTRTCIRCATPVIKQLVGHRAALTVIADAEPIPLAQALRLVEPNRLMWCLAVLAGGGTELRWSCRRACGHAHVIEHRCPPEVGEFGRRPEGAMW